jgi:hypothetical protein
MKHLEYVPGKAMHLECWNSMTFSLDDLFVQYIINIYSAVFSSPYSQTPSAYIHPSICMSDHVSHPHKTKGKIIIQYILLLIFLDRKLKDKRFSIER